MPPPVREAPRPEGGPPAYGEAAIARAERQMAMLDKMAEWGMELADALRRRAVAEALCEARALEAAPETPPRPASRPRASSAPPGWSA